MNVKLLIWFGIQVLNRKIRFG